MTCGSNGTTTPEIVQTRALNFSASLVIVFLNSWNSSHIWSWNSWQRDSQTSLCPSSSFSSRLPFTLMSLLSASSNFLWYHRAVPPTWRSQLWFMHFPLPGTLLQVEKLLSGDRFHGHYGFNMHHFFNLRTIWFYDCLDQAAGPRWTLNCRHNDLQPGFN